MCKYTVKYSTGIHVVFHCVCACVCVGGYLCGGTCTTLTVRGSNMACVRRGHLPPSIRELLHLGPQRFKKQSWSRRIIPSWHPVRITSFVYEHQHTCFWEKQSMALHYDKHVQINYIDKTSTLEVEKCAGLKLSRKPEQSRPSDEWHWSRTVKTNEAVRLHIN